MWKFWKKDKNKNEVKQDPAVEYVSMKDIVGKNLIPTDLVLFGIDEKYKKVKVYILNKKKTKLKTFQAFKNNSNKTVGLITYAAHQPAGFVSLCGGPHVYYADTGFKYDKKAHYGYNSQLELKWCHEDEEVALHRYCLKDNEDTENLEYDSFTSIEAIEKFIEEKNTLLKSKSQKEADKKKKCETFIKKTIDKSLDF